MGPNQAPSSSTSRTTPPRTTRRRPATITGKGVLNNRISEYLMTGLADMGIPTHFVRRLNMREQLVKEVEIIPVEVIARNVAAGSMAKRLGISEGSALARSIVEWCYKSDELDDPHRLRGAHHRVRLGDTQELDEMMSMTLRINDFLSGLFRGIGIRLVDFKIEFGRYYFNDEERIILADEISPDSCRLWT